MQTSDLCNLTITSEKLPDFCKVTGHKPHIKKGFLLYFENTLSKGPGEMRPSGYLG